MAGERGAAHCTDSIGILATRQKANVVSASLKTTKYINYINANLYWILITMTNGLFYCSFFRWSKAAEYCNCKISLVIMKLLPKVS